MNKRSLLVVVLIACKSFAQTKIDYPSQVRNGPAVIDAAYSTLQLGCDAAAVQHAIFNVTKTWNNVPTTHCNAIVNFVGTSEWIEPADAAVFTAQGYTAASRQVVWLTDTTGVVRIIGQGTGSSIYAGNFNTFAAACDTATVSTSTLIVRTPISLTQIPASVSCAANIFAEAGGSLQPASGQVLTLTGSFNGELTQHFDLTAGGTIDITGATIATIYPSWFGARGGTTDDTAAIQNTYNAVGFGQSVTHTFQSTISSMVYLPQTAEGSIINGIGLATIGTGPTHTGLVSTSGSTLIAKSGASPFVMFRSYASRVSFYNFLVNGGGNGSSQTGYVGTECFVLASAFLSTLYNSGGQFCSLDGIAVDPLQTPLNTSLTTVSPGSFATISVVATQQAGINMGTGNCLEVMLEPGTARAEVVEYLWINATTLGHLAINPSFTHTAPFPFQCNGTNDAIRMYNPVGTGNQAWGLNIVGQIDGNDIEIYSPQMTFNGLGGELLAGSGLVHTGGHSEGNNGPAIQLGDAAGDRDVVFATIGAMGDIENDQASYNTVLEVCGQNNQIQYRVPSEYTPSKAGVSCARDGLGTLSMGYGITTNAASSAGQFSVTTLAGTIALEPWNGSVPIPAGLSNTSRSSISTATVNAAGSGYTNGDIVFVTQSGAALGALTLTVSGGNVTAVSPLVGLKGFGYSIASALATACYSPCSGSGLTVNITAITTSLLSTLSTFDKFTGGMNFAENFPVNTPFVGPLTVSDSSGWGMTFGIASASHHGQMQASLDASSGVVEPIDINPGGGAVNLGKSGSAINVDGGASPVYRCSVAGAAPAGALTTVSTDCGTAVDTGLRIN